jgi:hypothetical protein
VFGCVVALFAIVTGFMVSGALAEEPMLIVSDFGSFAVQAVCAGVIIATAVSYGRGERVARPWWLIGLAIASYALGDLAWAYIEVVLKADPWPSIADAFYGLEYVFMFAGILLAALAYRHVSSVRLPLIVAALTSIGLAIALYFAVLLPGVFSADGTVLEKAVSAGYPLADTLLLVGPALFVALLLVPLGTGRLAWPWWIVAAGAVLLAASDTVYAVQTTFETYTSGSLIDYGWMAASVVIAFGALVARDVARA